MLIALLLSRALLCAAPAAGTATVIVREEDQTSSDVVSYLARYAPEYAFWDPRPENVDSAGIKLHLMPYYLADGEARQRLDGEVKSLLEAAQKKTATEQPTAIRDAWFLAFHLPVQPPDPRNLKILFAERRLIDAYLRINADNQAQPLVEEYVTRQPLDTSIELNPRVQPVVTRVRRQAYTELSVEIPNLGDELLSLDGQDFVAPHVQKVLPGVHELVVRFGQKETGLLHRVEVSGKTMHYVIDPALDRTLAFTPSGFVLRRNQKLTPAIAAFVADGTNVASVWLVEKKSDAPPALLLSIVKDGKLRSAQVTLPKDTPLLPQGDIDGQKKLARAIIAASQAALSEEPPVLADYDVTSGSDGVHTLLPRGMEPEPLYKKWWLWTAVGAVVTAGVVTTAALVATHKSGVILTTTVTPIAR